MLQTLLAVSCRNCQWRWLRPSFGPWKPPSFVGYSSSPGSQRRHHPTFVSRPRWIQRIIGQGLDYQAPATATAATTNKSIASMLSAIAPTATTASEATTPKPAGASVGPSSTWSMLNTETWDISSSTVLVVDDTAGVAPTTGSTRGIKTAFLHSDLDRDTDFIDDHNMSTTASDFSSQTTPASVHGERHTTRQAVLLILMSSA